jgi:hypothetical protein
MKKLSVLIILLLGICTAHAQGLQSADSAAIRKLTEMMDRLQKADMIIRETARKQRAADSLRILALQDSLKGASENYRKIDMELDKVTSRTKELTKKLDMSAKGKFEVIANNMVTSADLFEELNKRMNTLIALNETQNYQNMITQLNNPTDGSMGFSYQGKVMELLDKNIPIKKDKGRFLAIADAVLKNPIVNGIASLTPVVSIGNNILNLVSSYAATNKDVDASNISSFKNSLGSYTIYYTKLNDANNAFQANTKNFNVDIVNLHQKMEDFVVMNIKETGLNVENKPEGVETGEYLNLLFRTYNERNMKKYLDDIVSRATVNGKPDYEKALAGTKLEVVNSRIDDVVMMYREFDNVYRRYISMIDEYNEEIIKIMEFAVQQNLSSDNNKAREMIEKLKKSNKDNISRTRTSVNIYQVEELAKTLVRR